MDKIKEYIGKLSGKTKKLIIAGAVGIVAFAVVVGVMLNNRPYGVLFTEVSSEEAKQIIGKLQEDGVPYQYNNGDILVPEDQVDVTKAKLVSEDYPKSGFTYDIFRNNVSMMTTDADRQAYMLYDLENRIGATIQLFEGVKEAHVTIALGKEQKYALQDDTTEPSAMAVVIMEDGGSPTEEQASSIQRLISRSIPGLVIQNVSVFDGNGREVSVATGNENEPSGKEGEEISQVIEDQIAQKILNMLGAIYGQNNVKVAVKGKVNMQKLLRETITYSTPEKIDEEDKQGITSEESIFREYTGDKAGAVGVAGAESNSDIPQYNTQAQGAEDAYGSSNIDRKYLVNQIREQGQVAPGVLEDLSISIAINADNPGKLRIADIKELAGNAAGITEEEREAKIAVVCAPFYTITLEETEDPGEVTGGQPIPLPVLIGIALGAFVLIGLLLILLLRKKKKKKKMKARAGSVVAVREAKEQEEPEMNEELLNLKDEQTVKLRDNVRDFAEENPEISASLLKNWLNGGDNSGG